MLDNFKDINLNRRGSTLLLAMLVMAGVLTVSVASSRLVINEIVQSSQLDKAMVAFYAAESGAERGLFEARKKDFDPEEFNQTVVLLDNEASYQLIADDSEDVLYASLSADESYQLDLFDPHSLDAFGADSIKSLRLDWQGSGWLEINWSFWTTGGAVQNSRSVVVSGASSPAIIQLSPDGSIYLYRVRIIARNSAATDLSITAYNDIDPGNPDNCPTLEDCQVSIPARVSIKSLGEYPNGSDKASRQAILVTMPEKSPLSGLYDYVLYSESEVAKEN